MPSLKIAKDLFDLLYPIGTYYETSDGNWTPSSAGWYGTWVEDTQGRTTISRGKPTQNSNTNHGIISAGELGWNFALGGTLGEFNHPLLLTEMPSHQHYLYSTMGSSVRLAYDNSGSGMKVGLNYSWNTIRDDAYIYTDVKGNDLAHNNIQPSTVVVRWHRIA